MANDKLCCGEKETMNKVQLLAEVLSDSAAAALAAKEMEPAATGGNTLDGSKPSAAARGSVDTEHRDDVICPHCGDVKTYGENLPETAVKLVCSKCGNRFEAIRHQTVTYSTAKCPPNDRLTDADRKATDHD